MAELTVRAIAPPSGEVPAVILSMMVDRVELSRKVGLPRLPCVLTNLKCSRRRRGSPPGPFRGLSIQETLKLHKVDGLLLDLGCKLRLPSPVKGILEMFFQLRIRVAGTRPAVGSR
jgi:hypothetical protein